MILGKVIIALLIVTAQVSFANTKKACQDDSYRQFEFWVGKWEVFSRDGKKVGDNTISIAMNGCVLKEHYVSTTGYEGESFNIFNKANNEWHQTWVDNSGLLLQLDGSWNGHSMTLFGQGKNSNGQLIEHRIVWKPQKNGDVHQVWDISDDKGLHWKNSFFGVYKKQK